MKSNQKSSNNIQLRKVKQSDLYIFFKNQQEYDANYMAAFTAKDPSDREAFNMHWSKIMSIPSVVIKTIIFAGTAVGSVLKYEEDGKPEISYWISQIHWGKGITTYAVQIFLEEMKIRPVFARVAKDNLGSIRVLEKCGFNQIGEDRGFANARGKEIEELVFQLDRV